MIKLVLRKISFLVESHGNSKSYGNRNWLHYAYVCLFSFGKIQFFRINIQSTPKRTRLLKYFKRIRFHAKINIVCNVSKRNVT